MGIRIGREFCHILSCALLIREVEFSEINSWHVLLLSEVMGSLLSSNLSKASRKQYSCYHQQFLALNKRYLSFSKMHFSQCSWLNVFKAGKLMETDCQKWLFTQNWWKLLTRVTKYYRTVFTGPVLLTVVNCATVVKLTVIMCNNLWTFPKLYAFSCKENEQIHL